MVKNKSVLEVVVNNKKAELECPSDMSLGELFDALFQMRSFVIEKIKEVQKQDEELLNKGD